ncbi:SRPBCC family protein [Streptomyces sp. NPDC091377]|uniref:SRPBCC family protein n=1 Tax=Streptomyces sp. NPDC091377 TaxID=3365995 RepID=UPI003806E526
MSSIEESVEVAVPLTSAYAQWARFEDFPRFMDGVRHIERHSPALTYWVTEFGGVRREFEAKVTDRRPDDRIAWRTVRGDVRQSGVVTFHRVDDTHTEVMVQMDHDPGRVTDIVADRLGLVRRQIRGDLGRFKAYMEEAFAEERGVASA